MLFLVYVKTYVYLAKYLRILLVREPVRRTTFASPLMKKTSFQYKHPTESELSELKTSCFSYGLFSWIAQLRKRPSSWYNDAIDVFFKLEMGSWLLKSRFLNSSFPFSSIRLQDRNRLSLTPSLLSLESTPKTRTPLILNSTSCVWCASKDFYFHDNHTAFSHSLLRIFRLYFIYTRLKADKSLFYPHYIFVHFGSEFIFSAHYIKSIASFRLQQYCFSINSIFT